MSHINIKMVPIEISFIELGKIDADVVSCHQKKLYRPTTVALVENSEGKMLLLKSSKGAYWGFPQGGIHRRENVIYGLLRELKEETGIVPSAIRKFCNSDQLDIPSSRNNGYSKGKKYYYFHVVCNYVPEVTLQLEEVCEYKWLMPLHAANVIRAMGTRYADKRLSMLTALANIAPS